MPCCLRLKKRSQPPHPALAGSKAGAVPLIQFGPEEIKAITSDFSHEKLIAENEFASVYKCFLQDEKIVAVKQLKPGNLEGEPKFMALVDIMNRAKHPNLNSLLGYCFTKDSRTLVFEFAENNDLSYHLHREPGLSWDIRFNIAKGAAHALSYLHNECHPQIIHRAIKPANILLNNAFDAQVADFGSTKLEDMTLVVTSSIKTLKYVDPEYFLVLDLTDKSDVFSFGIILIEILTGLAPGRMINDPYVTVRDWTKESILDAFENGDFSGFVDPRLEGEYNREEVYKMARAILRCIQRNPEHRPTMAQVLAILEGTPDSDYGLVGRGTGFTWDVEYGNQNVGEPTSYADVPRHTSEAHAEINQENDCISG